jgi:hypothetical protein
MFLSMMLSVVFLCYFLKELVVSNLQSSVVKEYAHFLLLVGAIIFFLCRRIFVSDNVGVKALVNQGYTDIRVTERSFFMVGFRGCEQTDAAQITAVATNSQGEVVTMYVCSGWPFKGGTVKKTIVT